MDFSPPSLSRPLTWPLTWLLVLLGLVLAVMGFGLAIGGGILIARGGSWYYLAMGLALIASGVEIARGSRYGAVIYAIAFAATVAWATTKDPK